MGNIQNEELKEKILEELDNISLSEFQSLMEKHDYEDVNNSIDFGIQNLIQILLSKMYLELLVLVIH